MKFLLRCRPETIKPPTGKRVAVIGAGPAGLGAAGQLRCLGHEVDVYDALPEPGGLLIFGIPGFRVSKEGVREGVAELRQVGVRFYTSTFVYCGGRPKEHDALLLAKEFVDFNKIVDEHDAVVIATGTWRSRRMNAPGEDLPGVYQALDFLFRLYSNELGYLPKEKAYLPGSKVLVVGGGLTAIDAAVESLMHGAKKVVVAYRRTIKEAPAGEREIKKELIDRGIEFRELINPVRFEGSGRLEKVVFVRMKLGAPDKSGRPRPEPIPGSEFVEEFDTVLLALGEEPTPPFPDGCAGIRLNPDGTINVDDAFRTTREKVFAAGDVVHGPSLIGKALGAGMRAVPYIDEYLRGKLGWRTAS
ncbi:MAG: FAD-dependent oxidoreductase [Thermoproteus sp.]|nr:FAD-dependent oxidoreductase [Thermoproteus sp.]